jgi:hypothetical protein
VRAQLARDPGPLDWASIDAGGTPAQIHETMIRHLGLEKRQSRDSPTG